jgi:hypothetical protein
MIDAGSAPQLAGHLVATHLLMDLRFSTRSEFFAPIEAALKVAGGRINKPLRMALKPGGYNRNAIVVIRPRDDRMFWTDWESAHPTRFSARLRAAATILQRAGLVGRYRMSHYDGALKISRE